MDEARGQAEGGAPEGTVVVAEQQTAGRGRFDRPWASPPGENLLFAVGLWPTLAQLSSLNMAATLAVCEAIIGLTDLEPTVKWPNDVLVNGRKVSGILIETAVESGVGGYAVVGIGLNVNFDPSEYPEIASTATSLRAETRRVQDRERVLVAVLASLDSLYARVRNGESLIDEWGQRLETLGRDVQVRWKDRLLEGRATGIDGKGNLLLSQRDGSTVTAVAGEVTLQA
jgi:BirA family biotin operon repressor/biotin-[acetyl-CoA-carboxylase] ligase